MATQTFFTLGEASKATGISKPTLSKALKSGKLSYVEKTTAGYKIEASELFRVYPRQPQETEKAEQSATPKETRDNSILQAKLDAQEKLMQRMEQEIGDLRGQRDKWEAQATAQTRLLENQTGQGGSWWPFGKRKA